MKIKVRDNISLKTLTTGDADEVFRVIDQNREYLKQWLPWVDRTDTASTLQNVITGWEKGLELGTDLVFGIFKDDKYIGNIGLHDMKKPNNSAMIGYWLAENEQGNGTMTDCVRALVDYGFNSLSLNRIYIYCADKNQKSRDVPKRLGFVLEGVLQDEEYLNGKYFDLVVYGILKRNWR